MCVSGCPYKKVYFNWETGKAEKCIFCYPRIESGQPTICAETCVGKLRYIGVVLYDEDRIVEAASVADPQELYDAQVSLFLDPHDPAVQAQARRDGIPDTWIEAAGRSPIYKLAVEWRLAFPLHPEYRTLPMVWYMPPLSPMQIQPLPGAAADEVVRPQSLQIPVRYLANLLTAGKEAPIVLALDRMIAMRRYMRQRDVDGVADAAILARVGLTEAQTLEMYRYLAIANVEDLYVIPTSHHQTVGDSFLEQGGCGFSAGSRVSDGATGVSVFGGKQQAHVQLISVDELRKKPRRP